jgi:hypothetical protein
MKQKRIDRLIEFEQKFIEELVSHIFLSYKISA